MLREEQRTPSSPKPQVPSPVLWFLVDVFDEKDHLARLDQPELSARLFLNGVGVFTESARLIAQVGVLGAGAFEGSFQRGVLAASLEQGVDACIERSGDLALLTARLRAVARPVRSYRRPLPGSPIDDD